MNKAIKAVRKLGAVLVGVPVLILGIILIPLPGPGLLVCFLGLLILSTEFEWAQNYRNRAQAELKKIIDKTKERQEKINKKYKKD